MLIGMRTRVSLIADDQVDSIVLSPSSPDCLRFTPKLSMFDRWRWSVSYRPWQNACTLRAKLGGNQPTCSVCRLAFILYLFWGFELTVWETALAAVTEEGFDFRFTLMIRKWFSILYKSKHRFRGTHLHARSPRISTQRITPARGHLRFPLPLFLTLLHLNSHSNSPPIQHHCRRASIIPF